MKNGFVLQLLYCFDALQRVLKKRKSLTWRSCVKTNIDQLGTKCLLFLISCILYILLEVCILVHGALKMKYNVSGAE